MNIEEFLASFEQKAYGLQCLSKLMMRYLRLQPLISPLTRVMLWKTMTGTDKNLQLNPNYYVSLVTTFDEAFKDFTAIIELDVKRTPAAHNNQKLRDSLSNILLSYSK
jgi:hypothetical protein